MSYSDYFNFKGEGERYYNIFCIKKIRGLNEIASRNLK